MRQRPFDQFISPKSVVERRRFSDLDNDGVADNIDRLYDVRVTKAEVKSELDFTPVVQDAAASTLEGTSLYFSAQMLNRLCEFSGILEDLNPDSRVTNAGFYQASADDNRIIKFDTRQADGNTEYLVKVNARYAHMSENGLRAVVAYEFGLHMKAAGLLTLNELDTKLNALCLFAKSLKVDEAYDDPEIWKAFLERYNLPTDMDLGTFVSALSSGSSFQTAGSFAALQILKERLGPEKLALLASDSAGRLKAEWF